MHGRGQKRAHEGESAAPPKKKRRGGGGAWRAYTHINARAKPVSGRNSRELARQYAELSAEQKALYKDLGKEASALHRVGHGSFPCNSRRARYARGSAKSEARKEVAGANQMRSCEDDVLRGKSAKVSNGGSTIEDFEKLFPQAVRQQAECFLSMSKHTEDQVGQLRRRVLSHAERTQNVLSDKQRLANMSALSWVSFPHPCPALAAQFNPDALVPKTWPKNPQTTTTSCGHLAREWERRHLGISTPDRAVPRPIPQKCYDDHFCSCQGRGRRVRVVHSRLRSCLTQMREEPSMEQAFSQARIVLHWSAEPATTEAPQGQASAASSSTAPPPNLRGCQHWFTHIPLHYVRPWRPTLGLLTLVAPPLDTLTPMMGIDGYTPAHRLTLQATRNSSGCIEIVDIWQWLAGFDFKNKVSFEVFLLSTSKAPCANLLEAVAEPAQIPPKVLWEGAALEKERSETFGGAAAMWQADCSSYPLSVLASTCTQPCDHLES